ncbi:MAG: sigma-70 family RNA polymerase sigma factor [Deltaproteobacteria bacterium]|nr:sigma-70 family RNA polymerase sigma factor [Deltaproteobacteria bacterium]
MSGERAPFALPPEDAALVAELRAGSASAYERFVRENAPRVLGVARRMMRNDEDARDIVQDTFLSAFRHIGDFDGNSRLASWLHRIAVNAALMKLRSKRRRPEESIEELLPKFLADGNHEREPSPWALGGEAATASAEVRKAVRRAIDEMPDLYRDVVLLRDIEDLSTEEAARALGITIPALKTRLHRARLALRERLDDLLRELGGAP